MTPFRQKLEERYQAKLRVDEARAFLSSGRAVEAEYCDHCTDSNPHAPCVCEPEPIPPPATTGAGSRSHICGDPNEACDTECMDWAHEFDVARKLSALIAFRDRVAPEIEKAHTRISSDGLPDWCYACARDSVSDNYVAWPCPTIKLLEASK